MKEQPKPQEPQTILTIDNLENMLWDLANTTPQSEWHTDIIVTGGAALILCYGFEFGTTDIDGFNRYLGNLSENFIGSVKTVAREYEVQSNWLNDHMFECIEPEDYYDEEFMSCNLDERYAKEYYTQEGVLAFRLIPVSLEGILISKLEAGRDKDFPHMKAICNYLGIRTAEEIENLLYEYFEVPRPCMFVNAKVLETWL